MIINKVNVIYSDEVIYDKTIDKNIKVTILANVGEFSLVSCLNTIFKTNLDVDFDMIQYSKIRRTIYFYANREINLTDWENKVVIKKINVNTKLGLLEEIKNILSLEKNKEIDCVSLYDVGFFWLQKRDLYKVIKDKYLSDMEFYLHFKISNYASVFVKSFDYEKKELHIIFSLDRYFITSGEIVFSKRDGDLYIVSSKSYYDDKCLEAIGSILSRLYDLYIDYTDFENQNSRYIRTINSNFLVDIDKYGVILHNGNSSFKRNFSLSYVSDKNKVDCNCDSNDIFELVNEKTLEIFKKVYVKIDNCPEWMRKDLYQFRQNQLYEEKREEYNKERFLRIKRKFFGSD